MHSSNTRARGSAALTSRSSKSMTNRPSTLLQRIERRFAPVVPNRRIETIIDGRLDNHTVARVSQGLDDGRNGRHDTRRIDDPLRFDMPIVAPLEPPDNRPIIGLGDFRIAINTLLGPPDNGIDNSRSRPEIHVGNPHGQHVCIGWRIPFHTIRAAAQLHRIEKFIHIRSKNGTVRRRSPLPNRRSTQKSRCDNRPAPWRVHRG